MASTLSTMAFMPPICGFDSECGPQCRVLSVSSPRPRPTCRSPPPSVVPLPVTDVMPALPTPLPPTPSPSVHTPTRQSSMDFQASNPSMLPEKEQDGALAGPSDWQPQHYAQQPVFPPTPPVLESEDADSPRINFAEEMLPIKRSRRPARRPLSAYQDYEEPICPPYRKYTDPTPHTGLPLGGDERLSEQVGHDQQLHVDLDAYSATDFESEENGCDKEPTLSFVTTSTHESTTSTPPISMSYGYASHLRDKKSDSEPKIRMRSTVGRASMSNTYSSAESSIGSGAYSYHAYDQMYNSRPPPLPQLPDSYSNSAGLGITTDYPTPTSADYPHTGRPTLSPSHSFSLRPWKKEVANRLRSDSASSAFTSASTSTDLSGASSSRIPLPDAAYHFEYDNFTLSYEREAAEPEAIAMIQEGRGKMLNMDKINALGGIIALTDDVIRSLSGVTHLLLSSCGSQILDFLPRLLSVLAPSLVVLDLSNNNLCITPESLRYCASLEELNLSDNPLRVLPSSLEDLVGLRVLVADGCGLSTLPSEISMLHSLHTICVRRNKLVGLPSWLCLLNQLETLKVDGNPFTPEWAQIVPPILGGPSVAQGVAVGPKRHSHHRHLSINNGLRTPVSAMSFGTPQQHSHSAASSISDFSNGNVPPSAAQSAHNLPLGSIAEDFPHSAPPSAAEDGLASPEPVFEAHTPKGLRKMRSAGALFKSLNQPSNNQPTDSLVFPSHAVEHFANLEASEGQRATSAMGNYPREQPQPSASKTIGMSNLGSGFAPKSGKWGFLRKMSMKSLRPDKDKTAAIAASAASNLKTLPPLPPMKHQHSDPIQPVTIRPDMISSMSAATLPTRRIADLDSSEFGQVAGLPAAFTMPVYGLPLPPPVGLPLAPPTGGPMVRGKRRSFLPIDGPPSINVQIPTSVFAAGTSTENIPILTTEAPTPLATNPPSVISQSLMESSVVGAESERRYAKGLDTIKLILRDLYDLSRRSVLSQDGFTTIPNGNVDSSYANCSAPLERPGSPMSSNRDSFTEVRRARRPTLETYSQESGDFVDLSEKEHSASGKKFRNDKCKRSKIIKEIWETERTYVRNLGELVNIYVRPATQPLSRNNAETIVPVSERKIVFGGVESILAIHRDNFLPALEKILRKLIEEGDDEEGSLSTETAYEVGEVFRTYIAYMKQYSTYITNFDNALSRMKTWSTSSSGTSTPSFSVKSSTPSISAAAISVGMSAISLPSTGAAPPSGQQMTSSQRKRVKTFLKKCKEHPTHSQINLESYLLLPIQRIPRYKLLLTELAMCTPARVDGLRDTIDDSLTEIAGLASLMNEEKRDADSRLRLLNWQKRFVNSGRSPLVQPHRRLILEGVVTLSRIVKKASSFAECETIIEDSEHTITPGKAVVPVDYIMPETVEKDVMLILCSDMMVLATERGEGWEGSVNVFNVLRMGTMHEPASVTSGNILRVVDNNSIYYFKGTSRESTVQWCRAINTARR
ncbi:uncharacterized protein L203_100270 [Cryptococcus depauperatus CBS 7841]|uniref:Uncharacterized protein n=1 Tax=Cryptococcus depauperatus CBS 7841 TaxID=1295531 RepID=A0A1E3IZ48_9TREE|nr:hypothetical protein L203_00071 [Cryptococcus depauperatus CBS 7841]